MFIEQASVVIGFNLLTESILRHIARESFDIQAAAGRSAKDDDHPARADARTIGRASPKLSLRAASAASAARKNADEFARLSLPESLQRR